ncbi:MAG: precorrin-6y C5,15-methyltransferase (decarboxylating) subunit CbiE [Desulfuromonadaceae bacterium]|nr:precorrin-6y C5,15-methyltransferase (decarboxylating) subunit CbiE [Desulfuromonadaceae bacterium]
MGTIHVVGAGIEGQEGFSQRALQLVEQADVIIGTGKQLARFSHLQVEKLPLENESDLCDLLRGVAHKDVVVLTSGDPLFFSIGRELLRNIPEENLEFVPNVTSAQFAFARIKQPWDDAVFISAEGLPLRMVVNRIIANDKVAVLTHDSCPACAIAEEMLHRGREGYSVYVCENLGGEDERIEETTIKELLKMQVSPLNVLIFIKRFDKKAALYRPTLGINDSQFQGLKKQITPEEVRVIALAKLQLRLDMTLWDIGAGSGSLCIEADFLLPHGRIYAVERNSEYLGFLRHNLNKFSTRNVRIIEGEAPACLENLPDPDRVFIGGSGGKLWGLLETIDERLKPDGRIVLTATTLDTLSAAVDFFENNGYLIQVTTINVARTSNSSDYKIFEAQNPVNIIMATKNNCAIQD